MAQGADVTVALIVLFVLGFGFAAGVVFHPVVSPAAITIYSPSRKAMAVALNRDAASRGLAARS